MLRLRRLRNSFGVSDGGLYVLSVPYLQLIRYNQESNDPSWHHCSHVGGITSEYSDDEPYNPSVYDTTSMFAPGLEIFLSSSCPWSTTYYPRADVAANRTHLNTTIVVGVIVSDGVSLIAL